jgi:CubicO group peptidase (beta-lactamase class C family)
MSPRWLLLVVVACALAARAGGEDADARSRAVDALVNERLVPGGPGAAVMVIQAGAVVHVKGYGLADIARKIPITGKTAFDLASVSKQFTAMAVMMLAEAGELSYADPLSRFFPELPDWAAQITVRNLLQHTSGLPDYMALYERDRGHAPGFMPTERDALALIGGARALEFPPGSRWEYSNSGYVVLALIVEQASGQRYAEYLAENIFGPLGMKDTVVYDERKPAVANRAISYAREANGFADIDANPLNLIYGDGSVNTTVEDMFRWDQALLTERLVKASTLAEAFTPGKLNDGSSTGYGFGWSVQRFLGLDCVGHGGGWVGFRTFILRFPSERFSVIVLSNWAQFDPDGLSKRIARVYLGDRMKLPVAISLPHDALAAYPGRYDAGRGRVFTVTLDGEQLWLASSGQSRVKLMAEAPDEFFLEGREDTRVSFHHGDDGVQSLTFHQVVDLEAKRTP